MYLPKGSSSEAARTAVVEVAGAAGMAVACMVLQSPKVCTCSEGSSRVVAHSCPADTDSHLEEAVRSEEVAAVVDDTDRSDAVYVAEEVASVALGLIRTRYKVEVHLTDFINVSILVPRALFSTSSTYGYGGLRVLFCCGGRGGPGCGPAGD